MSWRGWPLWWVLALCACSEPRPEAPPEGTGAAAQEAGLGERAYMRCRACHALAAGEPHKVGPNLHGFMSRPAATAEGYTYSPELVAAGLNWDAGTLAAWITDPAFTVPGTTMVYPNDLAGAELAALIAYLEIESKK